MAFFHRDLTVLAYADGYTLWHYSTDDTSDEVMSRGYFDDARDFFEPTTASKFSLQTSILTPASRLSDECASRHDHPGSTLVAGKSLTIGTDI